MFTKKHANQMLNNWLEILLDFDFEVIHRPGILHVLPHALSRFYDTHPKACTTPPKIWTLAIDSDESLSLTPKLFERIVMREKSSIIIFVSYLEFHSLRSSNLLFETIFK